jgi:hypothetical protein
MEVHGEREELSSSKRGEVPKGGRARSQASAGGSAADHVALRGGIERAMER